MNFSNLLLLLGLFETASGASPVAVKSECTYDKDCWYKQHEMYATWYGSVFPSKGYCKAPASKYNKRNVCGQWEAYFTSGYKKNKIMLWLR